MTVTVLHKDNSEAMYSLQDGDEIHTPYAGTVFVRAGANQITVNITLLADVGKVVDPLGSALVTTLDPNTITPSVNIPVCKLSIIGGDATIHILRGSV